MSIKADILSFYQKLHAKTIYVENGQFKGAYAEAIQKRIPAKSSKRYEKEYALFFYWRRKLPFINSFVFIASRLLF